MNKIKIIFFNLLIFLILIIFFELIFGSWLKKDNFGFIARELRNVKIPISVQYNKIKYDYIFERNNLGFIGKDIKAEKIDILFMGGSTGEEMFVPPNYSIVGQINNYFREDNLKHNITNASKGGKSTRGYVNDFIYWFSKIDKLNPKIVIFYIGINDSLLKLPKHFDEIDKKDSLKRFEDYFKNNSILYKLKKDVQNKYFNRFRVFYSIEKKDLYINFNFLNYSEAKNLFLKKKLDTESKNIISNFDKNLNNLKKIIDQKKFLPIFITQIKFNGLADYNLFLVNQHLKHFCYINNFNIIKLDESVENLKEGDFYDELHTTVEGSKKISKLIYGELKKIIISKY